VRRFLITGALGQIGSELVPALRRRYGADPTVSPGRDPRGVVTSGVVGPRRPACPSYPRVRFFDPDRYAVPESVDADDETVIPMILAGKRRVFEVRVEGQPVKFLVDTGSPFPLTVDGGMAEKAHLPRSRMGQGARRAPAQVGPSP
jgi:hypothetical protein